MTARANATRGNKGSRRRWLVAPAAIGALTAAVVAGQAQSAVATSPTPANISIDFGHDQGPLVHTERYNNFPNSQAFPAQRSADAAYLNSQGLHGSVYRTWVNSANDLPAPWPCTSTMGTCTLDPRFNAYLSDAESVSDAVLLNFRVNGATNFYATDTPATAEPKIERILLAAKRAHPKLTYIESSNEPDAPPAPPIPASQVYPWYAAINQAVDNINATLAGPGYVPMKIGGPALSWSDPTYMNAFLDGYVADPNPGKRLDFISYHAYFSSFTPPGSFQFLKGNPSLVAGERAQLDSELQAHGLPTNLPAFITESGIYPGPMCDACDSSDYLRNAAGTAAVQYWYAQQHDTYPFNWVTRHDSQALKDEFVTRNSTGPYLDFSNPRNPTPLWPNLSPIPTNAFTPYGNTMLMQSMMKSEKVSATSDSLSNGIGVYANASYDRTGASAMVWNYQGCSGLPPAANCPTAAYHASINMTNLPSNMAGHVVREHVYLVDQSHSNAFPSTSVTDPSLAGLQEVKSATVTLGSNFSDTVDLQPNAIALIVLTPLTPTTKDACKKGGWQKYVDNEWNNFKNQGDCVSWVNHK
jgi:hypothetical protein